MTVHDFNERLEFSLGERESFDINLLKNIIPDVKEIEKTNVELDKRGIDYVIMLNQGAEIYVDAKTRDKGASKYWSHEEPELALEIYSVYPEVWKKGKVGWACSECSNVDYILYTFDRSDTDKFYFLPFQLLRTAYKNNFDDWNDKYKIKAQPNHNWHSFAVFIPASVLIKEITNLMSCFTIAK